MKNYNCFFKNRINQERASDIVTISANKETVSHEVNINTNLEVIAISIKVPQCINTCNIYVPPNQSRYYKFIYHE